MARRLTKEQLISNVYYDIEEGFGSKQATLAKARKEDPTKTKEGVDKFVRQHPNKQVKTYCGTNSYTAPFARFEYQIDIMEMVSLISDPEANIPLKKGELRYGLVVIDILSKLANVAPMKDRKCHQHTFLLLLLLLYYWLPFIIIFATFTLINFRWGIFTPDHRAYGSVRRRF